MVLGFINHEFHERVALWFQSNGSAQLASCSITELRARPSAGIWIVAQARTLLLRLKRGRTSRLVFILTNRMSPIFAHYMLNTDTCSSITRRSNDAVLKRQQKIPGVMCICSHEVFYIPKEGDGITKLNLAKVRSRRSRLRDARTAREFHQVPVRVLVLRDIRPSRRKHTSRDHLSWRGLSKL